MSEELTLRCIGDLHGGYDIGHPAYDKYQELISAPDIDLSVQVGDFGFNYEPLMDLDPQKHYVIPGNHDDYKNCLDYPHVQRLRKWKIGSVKLFALGGAWSIDKHRRTPGLDWFHNEELHFRDLYMAYRAYIDFQPDILISHECSTEGIKRMGFKGIILDPPFHLQSMTQQTLQHMIDAHRPKLAISGHWHCRGSEKFNGCEFVGLGIEDYVDIKFNDTGFKRLSRS